jgi:hypothetical protein
MKSDEKMVILLETIVDDRVDEQVLRMDEMSHTIMIVVCVHDELQSKQKDYQYDLIMEIFLSQILVSKRKKSCDLQNGNLMMLILCILTFGDDLGVMNHP